LQTLSIAVSSHNQSWMEVLPINSHNNSPRTSQGPLQLWMISNKFLEATKEQTPSKGWLALLHQWAELANHSLQVLLCSLLTHPKHHSISLSRSLANHLNTPSSRCLILVQDFQRLIKLQMAVPPQQDLWLTQTPLLSSSSHSTSVSKSITLKISMEQMVPMGAKTLVRDSDWLSLLYIHCFSKFF
jgi:hypothetical protein